ncbi:MAG TPA: hemerythrin domain-containing protein [bacterium]|nr:hemerythrin domain-containing protein [bacterium]
MLFLLEIRPSYSYDHRKSEKILRLKMDRLTSEGESINESMTSHHHMLATIFKEWKRLRKRNGKKSLQALDKLAEQLLLHIEIEEKIIFPIYEITFTGSAAVTPILKQQHTRIKEYLNTIRKRMPTGLGESFGLDTEFARLLDVHNATEEYAVYPWIDELVGSEENEMVFSILDSFCWNQLNRNNGRFQEE